MCHDCPYRYVKPGDVIENFMTDQVMETFPHLGLNVKDDQPHACHHRPIGECKGSIAFLRAGLATNKVVKPGTIRVTIHES